MQKNCEKDIQVKFPCILLFTQVQSHIIGVNLWPRNEAVYLPVLSVAFFEFIPVDNFYEEQPKVHVVVILLFC